MSARNEEGTPPERPPAKRGTHVGLAIVFGLYAAFGALVYLTVPAFEQMFMETGVAQTSRVEWLFWVAARPPAGQALLIAVFGPLALAELFEKPSRRCRKWILIGLGMMLPLILVSTVWVLIEPLTILHCPHH